MDNCHEAEYDGKIVFKTNRQLKFSTTSTLGTEMTYLWIFVGCYVVAAIAVVSYFLHKNRVASALLGSPTSDAAKNFHRMM